jgi:hypothetical protein
MISPDNIPISQQASLISKEITTGEESVYRIYLQIETADGVIETKPCFIKHLDRDRNKITPISSADEYLEKLWQPLIDAGIPVVPMSKYDENTIIMPDLTADGSFIVDKHLFYSLKYFDSEVIRSKRKLKKAKLPDLMEVYKEIDTLTYYATAKYVNFPIDSGLILLIHPSGAWKVMLLDISYLFFKVRSEEELFGQHKHSSLNLNIYEASKMKRILELIYKYKNRY